jgi:N-acetylmuramoyl-L-alanine amidase
LRVRSYFPAVLFLLVIHAALLVSGAAASTLTRIRYSSDDVRTRVVMDLSSLAPYAHRSMTDPDRVVVEIPGGTHSPDMKETLLGDGYVARVRLNYLRSSETLQVVLDLERALSYKTFTLDDPPRLVVDVIHAGGPVPGAATGTAAGTAGGTAAKTPAATTPAKPAEPEPPLLAEPPPKQDWVVAIDAGHGGEDHGARYHKTSEKDITLALATELMETLAGRPGIRAFLVRKGDYYIPLHRRWALAEKQEADLFVSLHCNASPDARAAGTEVFFLSMKGASDAAAGELAQRENAVDELMGVHTPESDLDEILLSMIQSDVMAKSQLLAENCVDRLFALGTVYNRGVKQAGFAVLKSPRMPSVLVEAAFLSNKDESKLLNDAGWRQRFGKYLAEGIEVYIDSLDPQRAEARDKAER